VTEYTAYARIYRNGSPYGTVRSNSTTIPQLFTEDLPFNNGDLVQLYVWGIGGHSAIIANFRLFGDIVKVPPKLAENTQT